MKKFLASLISFAFLIVSQIQLVHAFDMGDMMDMGSGIHVMHDSGSIFCEKDPDSQTGNTQCAKDIIQDKIGHTSEGNKEIKIKTFSAQIVPIEFSERLVYDCNIPRIPDRYVFKSKSSYTDMIGISLKRLD